MTPIDLQQRNATQPVATQQSVNRSDDRCAERVLHRHRGVPAKLGRPVVLLIAFVFLIVAKFAAKSEIGETACIPDSALGKLDR